VARSILMDEFHLTIYVRRGLSPPDCEAIRQALDEPRFLAELRRAVRNVIKGRPSLDKVRVTVTR
jgi:hypothetical protein